MIGNFTWGKGALKRPKALFFFILCKGNFYPVDPVGSLEGLGKF